MKKCIKCGGEKDSSAFSKKTSSKDGLQSVCKACKKVQAAEYRTNNLEKVSAAHAKWLAENPDKAKASKDAWRARNKERERRTTAVYQKANADKLRAAAAKWRADNRDRHRALTAANYAANKERKLAQNAAWRADNPEAVKAHHANRRARKRSANGAHTANDIKQLFRLQRGKCACCRVSIADGYHVDHIQPLALGGSNDKTNLQLLCPTCNLSKSAKNPAEFMRERGFLI